MTTFLIPLTNVGQTFEIALAGKSYLMTCRWNDAFEAGWVIDLSNAKENTAIVSNIPLVTGVDLLSGLGYLGFEGSLYVFTDGDELAVPTFENLGAESNLYFQTEVASG